MQKRLHLIIKGRVQGVFYRYSTKVKARELDLKGYAKNMADGSVEIKAEGPETKLKLLLEWCWHGPEYAEVTDIKVKWSDALNEFSDFSTH